MDPQAIFFYVSSGILMATLWLQLAWPAFLKRHASRIFLYTAGLTFAYLIYLGFLQYQAFSSGVLGYTIGTGEGLRWFFGYVRLHFFDQYLIAFVAAIVVALLAAYFNRRFNERFFEREELYLAALAMLLVGYPAFLFYIALMLVVPTLVSVVFIRGGARLPLYHFWLPMAIVLHVAANYWLAAMPWWGQFRF